MALDRDLVLWDIKRFCLKYKWQFLIGGGVCVAVIIIICILISTTGQECNDCSEENEIETKPTKIMLIGGSVSFARSLSEVEVYIPQNRTPNYFFNSTLTTDRVDLVAVRIGKCIHVAGGYSTEVGFLQTTEKLCFDSIFPTFQEGPKMHKKRAGASAAVFAKTFLICGGNNETTVLDTCEFLNVTSGKFEFFQPKLPWPRTDAAYAVLSKRFFFVIGGINNEHDEKGTVFRLDWKTKSWGTVAALQNPLTFPEATVLDETLFVCGGSLYQKAQRDCMKYNEKTDRWIKIAKLNVPRSGGVLMGFGGKLYAFSGENRWVGETVEVFDPRENLWNLTTPILTAKRLFGAVAV